MHSKRASITIEDKTNVIKAKPENEQSEEELADYCAKLRTRPLTVEPLMIDNDFDA